MTTFSPQEKLADATGYEYQWNGMMIRDRAWRDTVKDQRRRRTCVAGDCMTTDYHTVEDRGHWGMDGNESPEPVGWLPILHIGSLYGWAGGRLCFNLSSCRD